MMTEPRETLHILFHFLRHPMQEISHLPDWSPKKTILVQALCASASGFAAGLLPFGLWKVLQGLLLFPITFSILMALLACFFYYAFQIFEQKTVPFFKLYQFLFFVHLPYFIFHVGSSLVVLADVAGLAIGALIMMMGLTTNFALPKRRSVQWVGVVFGALFLVWLAEKVSHFSQEGLTQQPPAQNFLQASR